MGSFLESNKNVDKQVDFICFATIEIGQSLHNEHNKNTQWFHLQIK